MFVQAALINRIKPADFQGSGFDPDVAMPTLNSKNTYR